MKFLIVCPPNATCKMTDFKAEENLLAEIKKMVANSFTGFTCVRIESNKGDGSSFLLNAIANELRINGTNCTFMRFEKGNKFSDLTHYHLESALASKVVLLDNIHHLLGSKTEEIELMTFLKKLANHNIQFFYSSIREEFIDHKIMIEQPFDDVVLGIQLKPLEIEQRKAWANQFLPSHLMKSVAPEIYYPAFSNQDFLRALKPTIDEHKRNEGQNFDEIKLQMSQLLEIEKYYYKIKLEQLDLHEVKFDVIKNQSYEKAADIRADQKRLENEIHSIKTALEELEIEPRPSKAAIELYHDYLKLTKLINAENDAFLEMVKAIEQQLEELNALNKELDPVKNKEERLINYKAIVAWTNVLEKYKAL